MLTQYDYYQFCMSKRYFTCGSSLQYERAFNIVDRLQSIRNDRHAVHRAIVELATVTWICSDPDLCKSIVDFEKELYRLYNY